MFCERRVVSGQRCRQRQRCGLFLVLKKPCTFSVRIATQPVKGTREQLYTDLPRGFTLLLVRLLPLLRRLRLPFHLLTAENESFQARASRGVRKLLFPLVIAML
jgi:hypothetical protein